MKTTLSPDTPLSDYSTLIDIQTKRFIARSEAAYPDNAVELDIAQQRQLYNAMCASFHAGHPPGVTTTQCTIDQDDQYPVPVRRYTPDTRHTQPSAAQLVYLHGGGFVMGGLDSHDDVCAEIAHRTSLVLTSVDYRLSPEHKHPAALQDTLCVVDHLWQKFHQPIILCGDSAGANLAAAACHHFRNAQDDAHSPPPDITGLLLIYPGLGGDTDKGSYITHAHSPMLSTTDVTFFSSIRSRGENDLNDPLFAPLCDTDFSALPPTVVFSAQCDPLSDDGLHYCANIKRENGLAHWINEPGLVHGYLRARHSVQRAADSFDRIIAAISALGDKQWPYP